MTVCLCHACGVVCVREWGGGHVTVGAVSEPTAELSISESVSDYGRAELRSCVKVGVAVLGSRP